ncbi:unnamed protein product [Parnassius apollo]|uniref:Regulatory protein zeste n=1 Tax=Parnassius apollo TaxID=110799 RepID=A0A8S3YBV2_PARAO|nr:unnamed protein product [Parnassius apollo]
MAPHTGSATTEQIDALLNFLDEHRDLARGRLRSLEGKVQAKRLWDELCNTLNSMGGCTKTVQQWQKVWFDRKHLAKKAAADSRRWASMTGGGPSVAPQLSHSELKVLSIMGDGFGDRQIGARVPAFTETNESRPSTYSQGSQLQQQSLDLHVEVEEYADPSKESQQVYSNSTKNEISIEIDTQASQSALPRRIRSAAGSDVRSRLYQYEDGRAERETVRNTELAGIRAALEELRDIGRDYLEFLRQNKR